MSDFARLLKYLRPYSAVFRRLDRTYARYGGSLRVRLFCCSSQSSIRSPELPQPAVSPVVCRSPDSSLQPGQSSLQVIALMLVGFTLVKGVTEYFSSYFMSRIGQNVIADLRSSLYDHVIRQAAPFFARHPTNELTAHLMSDAALVERSVSDTLRDLLRESVSLIVYLFLLFRFNWRLAAALLLLGPPVAYLTTNFNRRLRRYINSRQESGAEMLDVAQEALSSQRVVKAFGMEAYESARFSHGRAESDARSTASHAHLFSFADSARNGRHRCSRIAAHLRATQH
jgi:subfamily B ATP-binding cassette protein MsbA